MSPRPGAIPGDSRRLSGPHDGPGSAGIANRCDERRVPPPTWDFALITVRFPAPPQPVVQLARRTPGADAQLLGVAACVGARNSESLDERDETHATLPLDGAARPTRWACRRWPSSEVMEREKARTACFESIEPPGASVAIHRHPSWQETFHRPRWALHDQQPGRCLRGVRRRCQRGEQRFNDRRARRVRAPRFRASRKLTYLPDRVSHRWSRSRTGSPLPSPRRTSWRARW